MGKILHKAETRGIANHGWLKSHHSFSFGGFHSAERTHFGALRVLNDDLVAAGKGFETHPHHNMEIISIPLSGTLQHEDSEGNKHLLGPQEIQVMSAGSGILHSEFNASLDREVSFLQIWILPKKMNIEPRYDQRTFEASERLGRFQTVVSPSPGDGTCTINQDAYVSLADIRAGDSVGYNCHLSKTCVYFFIIEGNVHIDDEDLHRRDALGITEETCTMVVAKQDSQVLAIEVPAEI